METNKKLVSQHKRMAMGEKINPWGPTANVPKKGKSLPPEKAGFMEKKETKNESAEY